VQSDNPAGNQIIVLDEHSDGRLSERGTVGTGGLGGRSSGAAVDELASQDSLVYAASHHLLLAVNAGSNSLSVLSNRGSHLRLVQVLSSGGTFPDSVAVHGDLVYVLDAGGTGTVTGYRIFGDRLFPLPGSSRSLSLANTTPPNFLTSPGQVGFSPDGSELIVTTKASSSSLDVFAVSPAGQLSAQPTVTPDPGNVPFSFTYTPSGQLVVAEAGNSTLHTYAFGPAGSLTSLSASVPDGQAALCWITPAGGYYYVANAGSNNISAYSVNSSGTPSLVGTTGVAATTDTGPIDMALSNDGRTLYVEAGGAGAVDELQLGASGSLADLGSVAGLGAGIEGIAAS
jgi:DNA-binding beta-propeller fold protein YncE